MSDLLEPWDQDAVWFRQWMPNSDEDSEDEFCEDVAYFASLGMDHHTARLKVLNSLQKKNSFGF
jgi:hypothetical protein